jgi:hypothetical protein
MLSPEVGEVLNNIGRIAGVNRITMRFNRIEIPGYLLGVPVFPNAGYKKSETLNPTLTNQ